MTMEKTTKRKLTVKSFFMDYVLLFLTAILITVFAIITKQKFIKILPCYITLIVNLFDSKINRIGKLIGATNCIIYSIGYFQDGLLGNAMSALLYSLPIQVVTFVMWSKNKYKMGVIVRSYSRPKRMNLIAISIAITVVCIGIFTKFPSSNYGIIQGILFGLGFVYSMLMMFGYIEGAFIAVPSSILSVGLYIYITIHDNPASITYVIIGTYTLIRLIIGLINWIKLYKEQSLLNGGVFLKDYQKPSEALNPRR